LFQEALTQIINTIKERKIEGNEQGNTFIAEQIKDHEINGIRKSLLHEELGHEYTQE